MTSNARAFHAWHGSARAFLSCGAGREAPGKAFRLYTEAAYLGLQAASAPEIQRVSLASLALQLKQLGVADVRAFPFMDPPPPTALARALELLLALGALDQRGALSQPLGAQLVRLPLEPVFGKVPLKDSVQPKQGPIMATELIVSSFWMSAPVPCLERIHYAMDESSIAKGLSILWCFVVFC